MVSDGQAGMNIDETRSIDDEYSPGVFKVSVLSVCQHCFVFVLGLKHAYMVIYSSCIGLKNMIFLTILGVTSSLTSMGKCFFVLFSTNHLVHPQAN